MPKGVKSTKRPQSILQGTAGRGMQGPKLRITRHPGSFVGDIPSPGGSCSSWWQRFPFSHVALPGVQSSAGFKLLQTLQSPSAKDHYFLSCLSLKAAFISLSPVCQNVSVSSFNKYHLRCLQPKGKQEKHFSLLLSNQCVAGSRLPGAPLL